MGHSTQPQGRTPLHFTLPRRKFLPTEPTNRRASASHSYPVDSLSLPTFSGRDLYSWAERRVRSASAENTRARLQLAQRQAFLHDQEAKLVLSLQRSYRSVVQYRQEMQTRESLRRAVTTQLQAL